MDGDEFVRKARIAIHHGIIESIETGETVQVGIDQQGRPVTVASDSRHVEGATYICEIDRHDQEISREIYDEEGKYEKTVHDDYSAAYVAQHHYEKEATS